MKKNIWIMNHYAGSMFFDKGGRHYNFAKYLRRAGYEPVIFCANSKHGQQELFFEDQDLWHEHIAEEIATPFVFVKARAYQGNGKQRVLNMIDFYRNVKKTAREYVKTHKRPDIIYDSSVLPLTLVAGIQLAKHFGVKCICEVRDLWPESIVVYSTRLTKANPLIQFLYSGEKWIYMHADALIFTMEGAYDYIEEQGWEKDIPKVKVHYINNGVDLKTFQYNCEHFRISDSDLEADNVFNVVYTGSIRPANNLDLLIGCAEILRPYSDIQFLIYGEGDDLERLKNICATRKVTNCKFKGVIAKESVPYVLSRSDLNLLNYSQKIIGVFRFGSSQNKLFEYLASGKPVLANADIAYNPIKQYGCGIARELKDDREYAQAVLEIYNLSKEKREELGKNAFMVANEYDFKLLTQKLISVIEGEAKCNSLT